MEPTGESRAPQCWAGRGETCPPAGGLAPQPNTELLGTFIAEVLAHVQRAETALLTLETQPDDVNAVGSLLRAFHTIKGTAGFLPLTPFEQLAEAKKTAESTPAPKVVEIRGPAAPK